MKFLMLMIPAVYQGDKKVDPRFTPDPEKMAEMGRFNDRMGKALKIESLNGLHPQNTGARVAFAKGKVTVTDGPAIKTQEVLKWAKQCPAEDGDTIEIRKIFDLADFAIKK